MRIQNYDSDLCGVYCIYFVILRDMGLSMKQIMTTFTDDLKKNDAVMKDFFQDIME